MERRIHQDRRLHGVPIMQVMRCELEMPAQFAGLQVDRQNAISVEIVAFTDVAVRIGKWIAGGPVQQSVLRIIGAGQPSGSATQIERGGIAPCFRTRLSRARNGPEAPRQFSRGHFVGGDKSANAFIRSCDSADHQIARD